MRHAEAGGGTRRRMSAGAASRVGRLGSGVAEMPRLTPTLPAPRHGALADRGASKRRMGARHRAGATGGREAKLARAADEPAGGSDGSKRMSPHLSSTSQPLCGSRRIGIGAPEHNATARRRALLARRRCGNDGAEMRRG